MSKKKHPTEPLEIPAPERNPEIYPEDPPESPILPEEEPDIIPDEVPLIAPPNEVPKPSESPKVL